MNRKTFYTLSLTWGLPLTLIGAVVALFLLATKHRPVLILPSSARVDENFNVIG